MKAHWILVPLALTTWSGPAGGQQRAPRVRLHAVALTGDPAPGVGTPFVRFDSIYGDVDTAAPTLDRGGNAGVFAHVIDPLDPEDTVNTGQPTFRWNAVARATMYTLLIDGPVTDRVCTEIYGGGEAARITGTVAGRPVDVTVDRANGCGIADWKLLQPILVEPYDLARPDAATRCSGSSAPDLGRDHGELPPAVDEVRAALRAEAEVCDFEALAAREWMPNPTGRLGRPEEVGQLVAFLASDLAGYINGANLRIDGGSVEILG